jgi:hypothetical protein
MKHHNLKIIPGFFMDIILNKKTFEIRKNDRDYKVGDTVSFHEFAKGALTGEDSKSYEITYICNYMQKKGFIVFSFKIIGN